MKPIRLLAAVLCLLPSLAFADTKFAPLPPGKTPNVDAVVKSLTSSGPVSGSTLAGDGSGSSGICVKVVGQTVCRALSDWWNDQANVVAYGADPAGVQNSTAAIQAAANSGRSRIYAPKGSYKLTDLVTLQNNQKLTCDSRTSTTFQVNSTTFNLNALGVIRLGTSETGASIEDCGISFVQPQTTVRASLVQFPPAIYANNASRFQVNRVRVSAANICLTGINSGGLQINDFECGAFTTGIILDNEYDGIHIHGYHFWDFGIPANSTLYQVYSDGQTAAASIGRVDGLDASGWLSWLGSINITSNAGNSLDSFQFTNMILDGGALNVAAGSDITINQLSQQGSAIGASQNAPLLNVSGGRVRGTGYVLNTTATTEPIAVSGGLVSLANSRLVNDGTAAGVAKVSAGTLRISASDIINHNTSSAALVQQSGTGVAQLMLNNFSGISGIGIAIGTDNSGHLLRDNKLDALTMTLPAGGALTGDYARVFTPPADASSMSANGAFSFNNLGSNSQDTAFGVGALANSSLSGGTNTGFGWHAGFALTTGGSNTIFGANAMPALTTGSTNTAFGRSALSSLTTGTANAAFGYAVGTKLTTGNSNFYLGFSVGSTTLTTGSNNILIGTSSSVDTPAAGTSNYLNLQNTIYGQLNTGSTNAALKIGGTLALASYTVATLPTCNASAQDAMAVVTDATSPTYGGSLTGSGTVRTPVYCNGTAWSAH